MRFEVRHSTRYEYSVPVALGEHVIRMVPQGVGVELLDHQVFVDPVPSSRTLQTDRNGNRVISVSFQGAYRTLSIESYAVALVRTSVPTADPGWQLQGNNLRGGQVDPSVWAYSQTIAQRSGFRLMSFLRELNADLFEKNRYQQRTSGDAQPAAMTLNTWSGACRDLTVLFLECCRAVGLSGRFVSGYQASDKSIMVPSDLHAWPEVLLPDGNHLGLDPTSGRMVGADYLPICAAPSQQGTMPVEGGYTFQGALLNSTLNSSIQLRAS